MNTTIDLSSSFHLQTERSHVSSSEKRLQMGTSLTHWFKEKVLRDDSYLRQYGAGMSYKFRQRLEQSNREKNSDASCALILQTDIDHNGAFSDENQKLLLLQIAKTHRICLKAIRKGTEIHEKLEEASFEMDHPIELLYIGAHGTASSLKLGGEKSEKNYYHKSQVSKSDFASLDPKGVIILDCCFTGQGSDSLAQVIAETCQRTVIAPSEKLGPSYSDIHFSLKSGRTEMVSYYKGKQHMRVFEPGKPPEPVSEDKEALHRILYGLKKITETNVFASEDYLQLGYLYLNQQDTYKARKCFEEVYGELEAEAQIQLSLL